MSFCLYRKAERCRREGRVESISWNGMLMTCHRRTSTYTIGSSWLDETVKENGRTYHVYKDGSWYSFAQLVDIGLTDWVSQNTCCQTMR